MKHSSSHLIFILLSILLLNFTAKAQPDSTSEYYFVPEVIEEQEVYTIVSVMPEFVGGKDSLTSYLTNLEYPEDATKNNIQGTVYVEFLVLKDGSVSQVKILRGIGFGCDEAALTLIEKMPKWIPGKELDKAVVVKQYLPIKFILTD